MGLFFKKKKAPTNALPVDSNRLQLFNPRSTERIIEPEEIKEAAGVKDSDWMEVKADNYNLPEKTESQFYSKTARNEPLYIKINIYQKMLAEMEDLKSELNGLKSTQSSLESSEYNEESQFIKLKRTMKFMHDHLLKSDQILFKP